VFALNAGVEKIMKLTKKAKTNKVLNFERSLAYKVGAEQELYGIVATSFNEDKYYEASDKVLNRLRNILPSVDPVFAAKLAIYARTEMHMRTMPIVLIVELARHLNKSPELKNRYRGLVAGTVAAVVSRPDEIVEIISAYMSLNDKKKANLPRSLRKGLAVALRKFDEYQFAKYNRAGDVTLRDALRLIRPKPDSQERSRLYKKIVSNTLETPYTWEVELSLVGQEFAGQNRKDLKVQESIRAAKAAKWEELIDSGRLGYMALLRNLRNLLRVGVSENAIETVAKTIASKDAVLESKQLPFRFFSAYVELHESNSPHVRSLLNALEEAVVYSVENISGFDERTSVCIASDVSGSMLVQISRNSKVELYDIGLLLSQLLSTKCKKCITGIFGDTWKVKNFPSGNNVLANTLYLRRIEGEVGYSTNGFRVLEHLIDNGIKMNKVMMFTDCQMWNSVHAYNRDSRLSHFWARYKKEVSPEAKLYLFDLAGYGNTPIDTSNKDVFLISGWSDKVFNVLEHVERGENAFRDIEAVEIPDISSTDT